MTPPLKTIIICLTLFLLPAVPFARPPAPGGGLQGNGQRHGPVERWMRHMERTDPQEHQRLMDLRERDPQAFHEELRTRVEKKRQTFKGPHRGRSRDSEDLQKLDQQFKTLFSTLQAESPDDIFLHPRIDEARELMGKIFDLRQEEDRKEFEMMEQRLEKMKTIFNNREQNRDLIIDQQLQRVIRKANPHNTPISPTSK